MLKPGENINIREFVFSIEEIESFVQTKQDFLDGKTTARNWTDIEEDLNLRYSNDPPNNSLKSIQNR